MAVYRLRGELIFDYILQGLFLAFFFLLIRGQKVAEATAASLSGENAIPTT